jgi:hypothetical protein
VSDTFVAPQGRAARACLGGLSEKIVRLAFAIGPLGPRARRGDLKKQESRRGTS